jgi:hypothetical protein
MGVTGGGLDLKDTLLDGQERHIESSSTQVENENVPFAGNLLIKTVRDSGGGRLIDDTKDVETRNCTGILCGLTLRVVKVGGDRDNRICNSATKVDRTRRSPSSSREPWTRFPLNRANSKFGTWFANCYSRTSAVLRIMVPRNTH